MKNSVSRIKFIFALVLMPLAVFGLHVLLLANGAFAQTNEPPVAGNDSAVTAKNTPIDVDFTRNDDDPDGTLDLTNVAPKSGPTNGTAVYDPETETFIYTPKADFFGTDSFTYTVKDNQGTESNIATVTIDVLDATVLSFSIIPKKLNMNQRGVVPVVIRGTETVDLEWIVQDSIVIKIDLSSDGVRPKSSKMPGKSNRVNLKFNAQDILDEIRTKFPELTKGDEITLYLYGDFSDGVVTGKLFNQDTVIITGQPKRPKN